MAKKVILIRTTENEQAIYGLLLVVDNGRMTFECKTIENKVKSFPPGTYPIKYEWSPRFKQHLWELYKIPGRSEIKIHVANYYKDLEGCIALGLNHQDLNGDGINDLVSSTKAVDRFRIEMIGLEECTIRVVDATA
jgi:hypothetical protein